MDKYYDPSNKPKIFVVCHSMGSMQFMNILLRPGMNADGYVQRICSPLKYTAICLLCPFFDFVPYEKDRMISCCGATHAFLRCHYFIKGKKA